MTRPSDIHPELAALLACLHDTPEDELLWLAVADWLEEHDEPQRAELARLNRRLLGMEDGGERSAAEARVRELVNGGVCPCVPEVVNSVGMRFALVPAGTFWMGSPLDEPGRSPGEARHEVALTRAYLMGATTVTQAQYRAVTGLSPSFSGPSGKGNRFTKGQDTDSFPVENVSWEDATTFCRLLSARAEEAGLGRSYRLPTEAEWEHSCRGGLRFGAFHFGERLKKAQAKFEAGAATHAGPVGSYPPNAWGLYDMHGGVWEWCHDWYGPYPAGPVADPRGPLSGDSRVTRGGSWQNAAQYCRSASRNKNGPNSHFHFLGFRVVLDLAPRAQSG
jgi:uncharacterized protein (TIGR02996 family)